MRTRKKIIKIVIALILLVILGGTIFFVKEMIFSGEAKVIYGSRLKGIDKVKISDETKGKIEKGLGDEVSKAEVRVAGKLVYVHITVKEGVGLDAAKGLSNKVLEFFTDEQKSFYDIQLLIKSESENAQFPIIGYKQRTRKGFSWTKDRAGS